MEHYKYILKVAEELLYNACPQDLIQKYEMLKQISLQKANMLQNSNSDVNSLYNNSNQLTNQNFLNSQQHQSEKFCQQLLDSVMETIGLFLDVFQTINYSGSQYQNFSHKISEFNEITSKILVSQQQKQHQLQLKEPYINKNIYSFDKITQNMVRALYDLDNYIVQNEKHINQQNEIINTQQQQLKKINIDFEIQSQRSLQKQQIENFELLEKVKTLSSESESLALQLNEKKKNIDRLEVQIESQCIKISDYQQLIEDQRQKIQNLERDLHEKQVQIKTSQNNLSSEIFHKRIDDLNIQINNLNKQSLELNHFSKTFKDEFNIYVTKYKEAYDEFQKKSNQTIIQDERLNLLLFIAYLFQKFEGDNMWLVERLTEFGKENDNLKKQNNQIFNEISNLQHSIKNTNSLENLHLQLQREIDLSSKQLYQFNDSKQKLKEFLLNSENKLSQPTNQSQK
ncbi:hypothetical protein ABPG72_015115 [Tetrahymena utriculariae]